MNMKRLSLKRKLGAIEEKLGVSEEKSSIHFIPSVQKTSTQRETSFRSREIIHSEKIQPSLQTRQTPFPAYVFSPKLDNVERSRDNMERSTDTSRFPPMCQLCRKRKPPPNDFTQNCTALITDEKNCHSLETSVQLAKKESSALPETKLQPSPSKSSTKLQPSPGQSSLSQCPMCGKDFNSGFTMLDMDSHLASCLSSTDDDVQW